MILKKINRILKEIINKTIPMFPLLDPKILKMMIIDLLVLQQYKCVVEALLPLLNLRQSHQSPRRLNIVKPALKQAIIRNSRYRTEELLSIFVGFDVENVQFDTSAGAAPGVGRRDERDWG